MSIHMIPVGPDDFIEYRYPYARLCWTGTLLRHFKESLGRIVERLRCLKTTQLGFSGVTLHTFMTINPFQFRFSHAQAFRLRPPRRLINVYVLKYTLTASPIVLCVAALTSRRTQSSSGRKRARARDLGAPLATESQTPSR